MGKINRVWHEKNKMPKNPTEEQRAEWHLRHFKNCGCRLPTPNIQRLMDKYAKPQPKS